MDVKNVAAFICPYFIICSLNELHDCNVQFSVWENQSSLLESESASLFDVKPLYAYLDTQDNYRFLVIND